MPADLPKCEHGTIDPCFGSSYRAALRTRRLFQELMGVEDATPEFERLEKLTRAALDRLVARLRPTGYVGPGGF